jgi:tetratricopeptide (TPR) repeat protein
MESDKQKIDKVLEIFAAAKASVLAGSNHARRLELIDQYLDALRSKAKQLQQKRGLVTKLRTVREPTEPIVIDGKLDEPYWRDCLAASTGSLRELQTGAQPIFGTTVKVGWDKSGQNLYFGIRCADQVGDSLNIATKKNEDESIWYGDAIEIELETDSHSYYQLVVNPAGTLVDLDRAAGKNSRFRWESQAEVATHIAEDHWNVEIRIPVTDDENDPLNQVIGRKPSQSLPWHFNVCRQRIRDNGSEYSAFSPTGTAGFHVPMKFAHLYDGGSHTFQVDPTVSDFLTEWTAADKLMRRQQYDLALAAFVALSEYGSATDYQKSLALAQAANCARRVKNAEQATDLVESIPVEAMAMMGHLQNLVGERQWTALIEQFGTEDLLTWPFTQIGSAALARGQAYYALKSGTKADADFQLALKFTSDTRTRLSILRVMAQNRELVLQDDAIALEAYRRIVDSKTNTGSAEYFTGLQGMARLLSRGGDHQGALETFDRVDIDKLAGSWRAAMRFSYGKTLAAADRKVEAMQSYREVLTDEKASQAHRRRAKEALAALQAED